MNMELELLKTDQIEKYLTFQNINVVNFIKILIENGYKEIHIYKEFDTPNEFAIQLTYKNKTYEILFINQLINILSATGKPITSFDNFDLFIHSLGIIKNNKK